MMAPMPSESEKNICPAAVFSTSTNPPKVEIGSKLGVSISL